MRACPRCDSSSSTLPARPSIVVVDLDGTLLAPGDALDAWTIAALKRAANRGTITVVATGRPLADAQRWARAIGAPYVIALNGALLDADTFLWVARGLPDATTDAVISAARAHDVPLHVHTPLHWHPIGHTPEALAAYAARHKVRPTPCPIMGRALQVEVVGPPPTLDAIRATLPDAVTATVATDHTGSYLDVAPPEIDKATAMQRLLTKLGRRWSETLAIGDGENDCTLFKRAGTSIAMRDSVPGLLTVATHRTSLRPEQGAVRVALSAVLHGSPQARQHLTCLHRPQ